MSTNAARRAARVARRADSTRSIDGGRTLDFGTCPACGGSLTTVAPPGAPVTAYPVALLHSMPMCAMFDGMEAGAYLAWVCDVRAAQRTTPAGEA